MARQRQPIPGWSDQEVEQWLRSNRGSARGVVRALLPHLSDKERSRAVSRAQRVVKSLKGEGLDFSRTRSHVIALPKPAPRPVTAVATPPPPVARPPSPPSDLKTEADVSSMTRAQALAWTIRRAADAVRVFDGRGSIAPTLKFIADTQAELQAVRRKEGEEGLSMEALREMWPRLLAGLPADLLDDAVAEYLNRNPKHAIAVKKRATG